MTQFKVIVLATASLAFAMLTACGDGFKAAELSAEDNFGRVVQGEGEGETGDTEQSLDEQLAAAFQARGPVTNEEGQ